MELSSIIFWRVRCACFVRSPEVALDHDKAISKAKNCIGSQIAKRPKHKIDLRFEPAIEVDKLGLKYHRHKLESSDEKTEVAHTYHLNVLGTSGDLPRYRLALSSPR